MKRPLNKKYIKRLILLSLALLSSCFFCCVILLYMNQSKVRTLVNKYVEDRALYFPGAVPELSDIDLWIHENEDDELSYLVVYTYTSGKYPEERWWGIVPLDGSDLQCGGTDHEPNWFSFIIK